MTITSLPRLLPWEPKSIYELGMSFDRPFNDRVPSPGRRNINRIQQQQLLPKPMPIGPDQGFFEQVHNVVKRFGFMENGKCYMQKADHYATVITATLDVAAKRAINSVQASEHGSDFNAVPYHDIDCEGMETWGLYETRSATGNPYLITLYLPPNFTRSDALEDFISTAKISHEIPSRSENPDDYPRISQTETMWALVLEACVSTQCTAFAVSSYDRWVFGEFTTEFSCATVSSVLDLWSSVAPSVPEAVYQWTTYALGVSKLQRQYPSTIGPVEQDEWPLHYNDLYKGDRFRKLHSFEGIQ